jgi:hypothetical protein
MQFPFAISQHQVAGKMHVVQVYQDVSNEEAAATEVIIASLEFDAVEEVEFG